MIFCVQLAALMSVRASVLFVLLEEVHALFLIPVVMNLILTKASLTNCFNLYFTLVLNSHA